MSPTKGTPIRRFRAPDDEWEAAQAAAAARGETVSDVIRAALRRYVQRSGPKATSGERDE